MCSDFITGEAQDVLTQEVDYVTDVFEEGVVVDLVISILTTDGVHAGVE